MYPTRAPLIKEMEKVEVLPDTITSVPNSVAGSERCGRTD